jgi:hypothetical protein
MINQGVIHSEVSTMPLSKMTAAAIGAIYTLIGILGFLGYLGIFSTSTSLNVAHLAIGVSGLAVYFVAPAMGRQWAQAFGVVLGLVAIVGVVVPNPLDLLPIGGMNIVLHAASAAVLLYVGFASERHEAAAA